jgi:hypothetical protein
MCDFISWIELDGVNYFITSKQLRSKRGKELKDYLGSKYSDDVKGHGAINWFFDLKGKGIHRERTNFSNPKNFPNEIIELIKSGGFKGIGVCEEILTDETWKKYEEIRQSAWKKYQEIEHPAYEKYEEIRQSAREKYLEIQQPALKEYHETISKEFWGLAIIKENRKDVWK